MENWIYLFIDNELKHYAPFPPSPLSLCERWERFENEQCGSHPSDAGQSQSIPCGDSDQQAARRRHAETWPTRHLLQEWAFIWRSQSLFLSTLCYSSCKWGLTFISSLFLPFSAAPMIDPSRLENVLPPCLYSPTYVVKDFPIARYQGLQFVSSTHTRVHTYTLMEMSLLGWRRCFVFVHAMEEEQCWRQPDVVLCFEAGVWDTKEDFTCTCCSVFSVTAEISEQILSSATPIWSIYGSADKMMWLRNTSTEIIRSNHYVAFMFIINVKFFHLNSHKVLSLTVVLVELRQWMKIKLDMGCNGITSKELAALISNSKQKTSQCSLRVSLFL